MRRSTSLDTHSYETVNDDGSVKYDWGVNFDLPYFTTDTVTDQSGTITRPGYEYFTELLSLPVVKGVLAAIGSAAITAIVAEPILVVGSCGHRPHHDYAVRRLQEMQRTGGRSG